MIPDPQSSEMPQSLTQIPPGIHDSPRLPLVSIIITSYNYGHFLKDAIESACGSSCVCAVTVVRSEQTRLQ